MVNVPSFLKTVKNERRDDEYRRIVHNFSADSNIIPKKQFMQYSFAFICVFVQ